MTSVRMAMLRTLAVERRMNATSWGFGGESYRASKVILVLFGRQPGGSPGRPGNNENRIRRDLTDWTDERRNSQKTSLLNSGKTKPFAVIRQIRQIRLILFFLVPHRFGAAP